MTTFAGFGLPVQRIGHKICIVQRLQGVHWHSHRQVCVAFARQTPPGARQINDSDRRHACNGLVTRILPRPGLFGPLQMQMHIRGPRSGVCSLTCKCCCQAFSTIGHYCATSSAHRTTIGPSALIGDGCSFSDGAGARHCVSQIKIEAGEQGMSPYTICVDNLYRCWYCGACVKLSAKLFPCCDVHGADGLAGCP